MKQKIKWKYETTATDGNCQLFGVCVFHYEWNFTGEKVVVVDPLYKKKHEFQVYTIRIDGITKKFVAGEFSNGIWGFYLAK